MRTVPGGHDFHEDSDGDVDDLYYEIGFHNGPGCRDCGKSWCQHCTDSYFPEGYTGGRVLDGPSGDLPDGTLVRVTYEGTVNGYKNGFGELTVRSAQGVSSQYLRHDEDGAAVEVLSVPTPPAFRPNPLDGKPGSLWRDPETGTLYHRTKVGGVIDQPHLVAIDGFQSSRAWILNAVGDSALTEEIIARLVPAEEGE